MDKRLIPLLCIAIFLVFSGCVQQGLVCNKPYILVGNNCCLDKDSNNICDNDELPTTTLSPSTTTLQATTTTLSEIETQLPKINKNLATNLHNINVDFNNYDSKFKPSIIFRSMAITDSMISDMEKHNLAIMTEMKYFDDSMKIVPSNANTDLSLSTEGKKQLAEVIIKNSEYQTNKQPIELCLQKMDVYKKYFELVKEQLYLVEEFGNTNYLVNNQIEAGEFKDALINIRKLKQYTLLLKENGEARSKLGILEFNAKVLSTWDDYYKIFTEEEKYIQLADQGEISDAEKQYDVYSKSYNALIKSSQQESLQENLNKIDSWYMKNIGACLPIFENY